MRQWNNLVYKNSWRWTCKCPKHVEVIYENKIIVKLFASSWYISLLIFFLLSPCAFKNEILSTKAQKPDCLLFHRYESNDIGAFRIRVEINWRRDIPALWHKHFLSFIHLPNPMICMVALLKKNFLILYWSLHQPHISTYFLPFVSRVAVRRP